MPRAGRFHDFGQHPAHILRVDEENRRAVRAGAGGTKDALAHRLEPRARLGNVGDFETDMMLPAIGVLRQKAVDRRLRAQRLDQLDLGAVHGTVSAGGVDKTNFHPLSGHVEGIMDPRRTHDVAPEDDAVGDRRRRHADMVEPVEFH